MRELLDVAWAMLLDEQTGMIDRYKLRNEIDEAFRQIWPDRATFGESVDAESSAAMIEGQAQRLSDEERAELRRQRDERRSPRPGP